MDGHDKALDKALAIIRAPSKYHSAIRRLEGFDEIVRGWSDNYVSSARNASRAAGIDDDRSCDYIRSQYEDMPIDSAR